MSDANHIIDIMGVDHKNIGTTRKCFVDHEDLRLIPYYHHAKFVIMSDKNGHDFLQFRFQIQYSTQR